jgi:hypothetical protein
MLCSGLPLWSSGQSSWLEIQRTGFDSPSYQILWEAVGPLRGPLSLVSTIEELFERQSSGSGLESREYSRRDPSRWPRGTLYPQNLELTSPTSGGRSVSIVRWRIQATELVMLRNENSVSVQAGFVNIFCGKYILKTWFPNPRWSLVWRLLIL